MKEFVTAARDAHEKESEPVEFGIDGTMVTAYKPEDGAFALLMAGTSKHSITEEQVATTINFFFSMFNEDDQRYLHGRLLDRTDDFGIFEVQDIIKFLMEEWAGRPTKSSSGSTTSPKSGGRKSTRTTPALT